MGWALLLAGCASDTGTPGAWPSAAVAVPASEFLQPPPSIVQQGVPPIPRSLAQQLERYGEFRGKTFVDWHPSAQQMLVSHRVAGGSTSQLHLLDTPMQRSQALTNEAEPVSSARFEPRAGRYIVLAKSRGGNEASQLYRLDMPASRSAPLTLLTPPEERHAFVDWTPDGTRMLVASVPLDRTAEGGSRAEVRTTLWLTDPLKPGSREPVATLPGSGWSGGRLSPDGRQLALTQYRSAEDSQIWLLDLATGQRKPLMPGAGDSTRAAHYVEAWSPDGQTLWFRSNRHGEFLEAMRLNVSSGATQRLTQGVPWDVTDIEASRDGKHLALRINVDGRQELRLFDAVSGAERLPAPSVVGSITQMRFHASGAWLAYGVNGVQGPNQIHVLDLPGGRITAWNRSESPPGLDASRFREQEIIRWASFDGRTISGLISRPPARFTGKRPVLIEIHGGPEAQATLGFQGRWNYLTEELGIVVVRPNVRGSTGFGRTFLSLDNGFKREDSVKDIGALLDWIARQPELDANRVAVAGGSYGGYMSLAVSVHYADRIAGAVSSVGISHFLSFLRNTESYRRDLRRAEYGDERDPAMREFLDRISPLTNAARIRKPLFVVQGKNDPRVPYTEAEQIVAQLQRQGTPVWYMLAENEGHGFAKKENADHYFYAKVRFLQTIFASP